jgi:hydroxymethylpyrimidine/phosphomethylpyrimidine kinase
VTQKPARVLIVAGSDPSGGAGIQADIKTATAFGVYAMTAITAITVQDTTSVYGVQELPPRLVRDQILACLRDIGADAIKTGMMTSAEVVETVADTLAAYAKDIPLVVDPVLGPTSGEPFLDERAIRALKARLLPLATLSTPNVAEAMKLWGDARDVLATAQLQKNAVLISGIETETEPGRVTDSLAGAGMTLRNFTSTRIHTKSTHGTGCVLSTAIACGLAQRLSLEESVQRAHDFVHQAIRTAPGFGRGHGPLNLLHRIERV